MLEVKALRLNRGSYNADLDFALKTGTITWLRGGNGVGKTTLLLTLMGFEAPRSGQILCNGVKVDYKNPRDTAPHFSYAPQKPSFQFGMSVGRVCEVVELDLQSSKAELLGIYDFADRDTSELSGGEAQRLLLAIALNKETDFLFLDEPLASQDAGYIEVIKGLLNEEKKRGRALLISSHITINADSRIDLE